MILKWAQSVTKAGEAQAAKQGDEEERKVRKDSKLIDVAHEALSEKAASDRARLDALVRMGWPYVKKEELKKKVRKKVWDLVNGTEASPDMIEEITERISDVAEVDPFYKEMFEKE